MKKAHAICAVVVGKSTEHLWCLVLHRVNKLAKMRISMRMVDECMFETTGDLNGLQPIIEHLRMADGSRETAIKDEQQVVMQSSADNSHDWARRKDTSLIAHCSALLLAYGVNFVQDDSDINAYEDAMSHGGKHDTDRLIRGVQTRAKGGERSIMASISGTVTRI